MLTAEQRELITAAVDGELSAPEAHAFRRLLDASAEARDLYAKLKSDSDRVRALPRATPPADLRAKILAKIAATTPAPVAKPAKPAKTKPLAEPARPAPPAQPARREMPSWLPVAVAAGLLLCVTAGSFAFFTRLDPASHSPTAKNPWHDALPAPQDPPAAVPSPNATQPERPRPDPDAVARSGSLPVPPIPPPKEVTPQAVAVAPEPRPATHDLIAHQILPPLPPLDRVQVHVPFLRDVAGLDREDIRQELTDELTRDREPAPFRFDLFVRDTARGADVFQNAAKASGLTVFVDTATHDKLKKRQVTAVVVYTESLSAAELAELFAKLAAEDAKFSPRVCDSLHATPVVRSDELELKQVLGLDVGLYKRPAGTNGTGAGQGTKPADKPLSAGTIDSVTKTLTASPAKTAILMTWQSPTGRTAPSASTELKQFRDKRTDRKPTAVPAIIVIRPVG